MTARTPIVSSILAFSLAIIVSVSHAETIELSQLSTASLVAPFRVVPTGTSSPFPSSPVPHTVLKPWGYGSFTGLVIPAIRFNFDDNKGVSPSDMCGNQYPKHLGTDYAAPAGTPVYAIADGMVVRSGIFTSANDRYLVVQSGSLQLWTTLYGHLNIPNVSVGTFVTKGALIGTLFNYTADGDIPHLHLGIRTSPYTNVSASDPNSSTRGFACPTQSNYQLNKYKFTSPEVLKYYTYYY